MQQAAKIKRRNDVGLIPFLSFSSLPMELFDPTKHTVKRDPLFSPDRANYFEGESVSLVEAARHHPKLALIPREKDCKRLWDKYGMLDNIKAHSLRVGEFSRELGRMLAEAGVSIPEEAYYSAGLLHDLGKTYAIHYGANHSQVGAAWVMAETRNAVIAQAVLFHVYWPWDNLSLELLEKQNSLFLCLSILYADKRIMHDLCVSLGERYDDILTRYGCNEKAKESIYAAREQGELIEKLLSEKLKVDLDAYSLNSGRLVNRA